MSSVRDTKNQIEETTQSAEELRALLSRPFPTIPASEQIVFGATGAITGATGGLITGPGTGTSDSIPAMLSANEFVMKAKAVKRFGSNFMHMINRGILPKFAGGGLVPSAGLGFSPIPSTVIAGAGPNRALRPVNLTIPGIGTFPFFDESSSAENLQRSLRRSNLNKSAKLPNWYK